MGKKCLYGCNPQGCPGGLRSERESDTGAASRSSDTLNLPTNAVFREISHQRWSCSQVFRITTLLFTVAKTPHFATLQTLHCNSVRSLP